MSYTNLFLSLRIYYFHNELILYNVKRIFRFYF